MQRLWRGFYSRISPLKPVPITISEKIKLQKEFLASEAYQKADKYTLRNFLRSFRSSAKVSPPTPPIDSQEVETSWGTYMDDFGWMQ